MAQRDCICETHEAEEIVEEAAEDSTADRRDDRDVCEVSISVCPDVLAISEACSCDSRAKITRRVQAVCRLCSKSGTNSNDQPEKDHSIHTGRRRIVVGVTEGENETKQNGSCEEFREEGRDIGHVWFGSGKEKGTGRPVSAKRSDAGTTLVLVDQVVVVGLDEDRTEESAC